VLYIVKGQFVIKIESWCVYCFSSEVLASIENIIQDIISSLARNEAPAITIDNRSSWDNIKWAFCSFHL
jgi:hypothetical protein